MQPTTDGWSFPNFASESYPEFEFGTADMVAMFGSGESVCVGGVADPCELTAEAAAWARMVNQARASGSCEGMVALAQKRFNDKEQPVTVDVPDQAETLQAITRTFATQFLPEVQADVATWLGRSLAEKVDELKASIAAGSLKYSVGLYVPEGGHALLPYAVEYPTPDTPRIMIYDSNWPGRNRYIDVDLKTETWSFSFAGDDPETDPAKWTGGAGDMDMTSFDARTGSCPFCGDGTTMEKNSIVIRAADLDWEVEVDGQTISAADVAAAGDEEAGSANPVKGMSISRMPSANGAPRNSYDYIVSIPRSRSSAKTTTTTATKRKARMRFRKPASIFALTPAGIAQFTTPGSAAGTIDVGDDSIESTDPGVSLTMASGNLVANASGAAISLEVGGGEMAVTLTTANGQVIEQSVTPDAPALKVNADPETGGVVVLQQSSEGVVQQTEIASDGTQTTTVVDIPLDLNSTTVELPAELESAPIPGLPPADARNMDNPDYQVDQPYSAPTTIVMTRGGALDETTTTVVRTTTTSSTTSTTTTTTLPPPVSPTIGRLSLPSVTFGDPPFTVREPTSNSDGDMRFSSSNRSVATIDPSTGRVSIIGAGTTTIRVEQAATSRYLAGSVTAVLTVGKRTPVVTTLDNVSKTYLDGPFSIAPPSSTSNGAFVFSSSNSSVVDVDATTGVATVRGAGSAVVTVSQGETANYLGAATAFTVSIGKYRPTLSGLVDLTKTFGGSDFTIAPPGSSSDGALSWESSNTSVATVDSSGRVRIVGAGASLISVNQAETANHFAATTALRLIVDPAQHTMSTVNDITKTFGDPSFAIPTPSSPSDGAITFFTGDTNVITVDPVTGVASIVGAGNALVQIRQAASTNYLATMQTVAVVVRKRPADIAFDAVGDKTFGDADFTVSAQSTSDESPVTFASSDLTVATVNASTGTVRLVGQGSVVVTASQAESANYLAASASRTFTVSRAATVHAAAVDISRLVTEPGFVIAPPGSNSDAAFSFSSSNGAVASVDTGSGAVQVIGPGSTSITMSQAANNRYRAQSTTITLTLNRATPVLGTLPDLVRTAGSASFAVGAPSSTSSGGFSFTSSNPSVASIHPMTGVISIAASVSGSTPVTITATQAQTATHESASASFTLTVNAPLACASGGTCAVGDVGPGGGKVFFVDSSNAYPAFDYLEAAPDTQRVAWCDVTSSIPSIRTSASHAFGQGPVNTNIMRDSCSSGAAWTARDYRSNGLGGWFVPSRGEMLQMVQTIGGDLQHEWHWTSNEHDASDHAWVTHANGNQGGAIPKTRNDWPWLRLARAFVATSTPKSDPGLSGLAVPAGATGVGNSFRFSPTTASPAEIGYTSSDQSIATITESGLVTFVGRGSVTFTAAQAEWGVYSADSTSITFSSGKGTPQLGAFIGSSSPGLIGTRYVGYHGDVPSWFLSAPKQGEVVVTTDFSGFTSNSDLYSWEWLGSFVSRAAGVYNFCTASDDGSYIWLGAFATSGFTRANATLDNGDGHGERRICRDVTLAASTTYPIRVQFGEGGGGDIMRVSITPPGGVETYNLSSWVVSAQATPDVIRRHLGATDFLIGTPTSPNPSAFTFSSSNPSVATVNPTTGLVSVVGLGTTTITAAQSENDDFNAASRSVTLKVEDSCANGGYCEIGDTGPGGGFVFFIDEADAFPDFEYLEAAPVDVPVSPGYTVFCDNARQFDIVPLANSDQGGLAIGRGRANTTAIARKCATGAVQAVEDYSNNGKSDWYMPSGNEMHELVSRVSSAAGLNFDWYWTSTTHPGDGRYVYSAYGRWTSANWFTIWDNRYVRPIRQFSGTANTPTPIATTVSTGVSVPGGPFSITSKSAQATHPVSDNPGRITFTSSDPSVATIDGYTGNITFVGVGATTITASIEAFGRYSAAVSQVSVTVRGASCAEGGECVVGDTGPGGGTVFYVASSPQPWGEYLEIASNDTSASSTWCPSSVSVSGTVSAVGSAAANTKAITAADPSCSAASVASEFVSTTSHDDWWLPSSGDLVAAVNALSGTARALPAGTYWSSTRDTSVTTIARAVDGSNGTIIDRMTTLGATVRLVRGFSRRSLCEMAVRCSIGDIGPGGGVVFRIDDADDPIYDFLEVLPTPLAADTWCEPAMQTTSVDGADSDAYVGGARNTRALRHRCTGGSFLAAWSLETSGVDDWYLPSYSEMQAIVAFASSRPGVLNSSDGEVLWTSLQSGSATAYSVSMPGGGVINESKGQARRAFAVHSFTRTASGQRSVNVTDYGAPSGSMRYGDTPMRAYLPNVRDGERGDYLSYGDVTYRSSNVAVATIGQYTGIITPVGVGTTTITIEIASFDPHPATSVSFGITVERGIPETDPLVISGGGVKAMGSAPFTVNAPATDSDAIVTWSSSNPAAATIASSGSGSTATVTLVGQGATTITATYQATALWESSSVSTRIKVTASCQYGGACVIGDTGPGGGTIVAVDADDSIAAYDYLELAPSNSSSSTAWCSAGVSSASTSAARGSGADNTMAILTAEPTCEAALTVDSFSSGGRVDWYLPSADELTAAATAVAGTARALPGGTYLSSSLSSGSVFVVAADGSTSTVSQSSSGIVRPMRSVKLARTCASIKQVTGTNTDGVYSVDLTIGGVVTPTNVYCIMNSALDGGGWMLAMKSDANSGTFGYDANYWTTSNTLNASNPSVGAGDAKYAVFNHAPANDVLAVFPDAGRNGGSIAGHSYGWTWEEVDIPGGPRTLLSLFSSASNLSMGEPTTYSGFSTSVWSAQSGARWYGFNYRLNDSWRVRWGFAWNNENDWGSNDAGGGIGVGGVRNWSAGDIFSCCGTVGLNRSMRVLILVR